ncbi:MAG: DUF6356 family protein [Minwuiales bacterium]|nr:DUF6356 family protein [Minwuiales bacterium]
MSLKTLFTEHPASVDETYGEHFGMAIGFSGRLFLGSLACLVHAFLPFLCVKTGSSIITDLHGRMVTNRHRASREAPAQRTMVGDTAR